MQILKIEGLFDFTGRGGQKREELMWKMFVKVRGSTVLYAIEW